MADIDELLRQYENVGNPTGQQPLWSSPFAFLGSAPKQRPPIMEQSRAMHGDIGRANPYEMALAMAMGPKAPRSLTQRLQDVPKPPPRELLPYELPLERAKRPNGAETWTVFSSPTYADQSGRFYGRLNARSYDPAERALFIMESKIPEDQRGQGIGLAMYQRLIDKAHKEGLTVYSDGNVSNSARKVYEALANRGYQVQARTDSGGLGPGEPHFPQFSVRPPRDVVPEVAAILKKYAVPLGVAMPALGTLASQYGEQN